MRMASIRCRASIIGAAVSRLGFLARCHPTLWGSASSTSPMIMSRRTAQCRPDAFTTSARATRRGIVPSHGTASAAAGREAWSLPVACVWWPACSPSAENLASTATGSRRRHYVRSLCFHRAFPLGATVLCAALPGPGCHAALPRRAMLLRRFRLPRARVPRVLCLKPLRRLQLRRPRLAASPSLSSSLALPSSKQPSRPSPWP